MSASKKPSNVKQNLMDTAALALFLNIPKSTLSKWRSTGEVYIPFTKIGNAVRYSPEDVNQWIENNTQHKFKEEA